MTRFFDPLLIGGIGVVVAIGGLLWIMLSWPREPRVEPISSGAATSASPLGANTAEPGGDLLEKPMLEPTVRTAEVPADAWFTTIGKAVTGIDFRHDSGTNAEKPFPAANGSGIAVLDYDLDGHDDLYFATGTPFPIESNREAPVNRCYRNLGDFRFSEVTAASGLGHNGYSAGLAVGDYDNDGFPDVYVNCFENNVLYHNQGDGTFIAVTDAAQVGDPRWGTSAAFLDYDADGSLDLYVCNYAKWTWETRRWCGNRARQVRIYCSPHSVEPEMDALYHSLGDGRFEDEAVSTGIASRPGRAQGVVAADLNQDGKIDLYVGNDLNANAFFLNQGNGKFEDATEISYAGYDFKGSMQAGMGVDAADVTGDGLPELFVTNFQNEHNTLYLNMADGLFQDSSQQFGVYAAGLPWVGWGAAFADFDLDGYLDLVVTNGHVDDNLHLLGENSPYAQPPLMWRQEAGKFRELGPQAGEFFTQRHVGRALVVADLDNDGDQDLVIGHQDERPAILRNDCQLASPRTARSYALRLIGTISNRNAIGATITLRWNVPIGAPQAAAEQASKTADGARPPHTAPADSAQGGAAQGSAERAVAAQAQTTEADAATADTERIVTEQIKGGGSYLSSHDLRRLFAVPPAGAKLHWEVRWPSGHVSILESLQPDQLNLVIEPTDATSPARVVTLSPVKS